MTTTIALAQQKVADPCAIVAEHFVPSTSGRQQSNALIPILSIQKKVSESLKLVNRNHTVNIIRLTNAHPIVTSALKSGMR